MTKDGSIDKSGKLFAVQKMGLDKQKFPINLNQIMVKTHIETSAVPVWTDITMILRP